jgi:hypothetical protein
LGGVGYWRGRFWFGGAGEFAAFVVGQQTGGLRLTGEVGDSQGNGFGEAATLLRLGEGLAADAKHGGKRSIAFAGVLVVEKVKQAHGESLQKIEKRSRARKRVVINPPWKAFDSPTCLRQRLVDAGVIGKSIFSIT